ncbi:hypothetical protein BBJ28_00005040 [Nothophytophthora sp. Chile5]|nr:hypothetical protein BBJ28_00005040 [Nothophytophthora sp. Chile5]
MLPLPKLATPRLARGISSRVRALPDNVFAEISALATQHGAVNLGQGFPTFGTPAFVKQAAVDAINAGHNQYTRPGGHADYVAALAEMYSPLLGRSLDPMKEVVTFNGAQEGIASVMAALLEPGDEVVTFEPYFDAYVTVSALQGVKAKGVPFRFQSAKRQAFLSEDAQSTAAFSSRDFELDLTKMESLLSSKTKMLVLNTPHNPTGKVFSRRELQQIALVLERHPDVIVLADEVYEFMTYDGLQHQRLAALPGFFDRTISLFSAGKTFSCTGWRTGYAVGPAHLTAAITKAHSTVPFCGTTPFEVALASCFPLAQRNGYYEELTETLQAKRDRLCDALQAYGWRPIVPEGGYFVCCNVEGLPFYDEFRDIKVTASTPKTAFPDYQFAYKLCKEAQLAVIPTSPFFSRPEHRLAPGVVRLAFCKDDATLDAAIRVIESLRE